MSWILPYLLNDFTLGLYFGGLFVIHFQLFTQKFDAQRRVDDAIFGKYFRVRIRHIFALLWWPLTVIVTPVIAILFDRSNPMLKNRRSED